MADFMKEPCLHCPYRKNIKPYLTPERGDELAYAVHNPYNTFPCHKTTVSVEDDEGECDRIATENSKMCAGFLSLMKLELGYTTYDEDGFEASDDVYESSESMTEAHGNQFS
jgi:hypothetical protein